MVVFAYGSLMYEPELPEAVLDRRPARLVGWHRAFRIRSLTRGCPASHAPDLPAVAGFEEGGERHSLVLGTARGGHIDGLALIYPDHVQAELTRHLHRREGPGYQPQPITVETAKHTLPATTFVTNPECDRVVDLALPDQAQILAAATPVRDVDGRARGAAYLEGVLRCLDEMEVWDPRMEALGELVRRTVAPSQGAGYS